MVGGDFMNIKQFFDENTDLRLVFKYGVVLVGGIVLTVAGNYVASGMMKPEYAAYASLVLALLAEKFKVLDPAKPWPIVGAKPVKAKK